MTSRILLAVAILARLVARYRSARNRMTRQFKLTATDQLARDIFKQLIEINTTDSVGNTTTAAEAMAKRLRDAGYPESDIYIGGPNPRKGIL